MADVLETPDTTPETTHVTDVDTAETVDRPKSDPISREIRKEIEACRKERADLIREWSESIEFHRGKPFSTESDQDRIPVNKDWPRVKSRVAALFGQMPEVRLKPKLDTMAGAVPVFAKELNDTLKRADTDEAVYQCIVDNTSCAGIGVAMVDYRVTTDMVELPALDIETLPPDQALALMQSGTMPMSDQEVEIDKLFSVNRLSPSELIWPKNFNGFNFDKGDLIGRSGEMGWAEAKNAFKLTDEEKENVLGDGKETEDSLKADDPDHQTVGQKVQFDEVFYWAHRFDPTEKYFKKIRRIVFVKGIKDPVIHEDWAGQQFNEQTGTYVGACRFPIRVLKLNYVTDDAIPPSEAAIGRPQVIELNEYRTNQHLHRKANLPQDWVNSNKIDPDILVQLMSGTWKGIIPVNGRGEDAMGELQRANYPAENQMFERMVNQDLDDVWQSGSNQNGAFASGERSASEARIVQGNYDTRNALDRQHVAKFIQGIAEVMAGYLALFGDFEITIPEDMDRLNEWDRTQTAGEFVYEVIPDSMIKLDAHQQIDLQMQILNMVGKSGFVNPAPFVADILTLSGKDPVKYMTQPNPPAPEPLNISIRSAEDLHDPFMIALLAHTGQLFTPDELEAAKSLGAVAPMPVGTAPVPSTASAPPSDLPPAPEGTATGPEGQVVAEKISKRSDYE